MKPKNLIVLDHNLQNEVIKHNVNSKLKSNKQTILKNDKKIGNR